MATLGSQYLTLDDSVTLSRMISVDEASIYGLGISKFDIPKSWMFENSSDMLSAYGHDGYFGIEMYYIPEENITLVTSKGQAYKNKHVPEYPIWLTLIHLCEGEIKERD